jgi:hypothetical protein
MGDAKKFGSNMEKVEFYMEMECRLFSMISTKFVNFITISCQILVSSKKCNNPVRRTSQYYVFLAKS